MTRYRVEYTEVKPGGNRDRQSGMVYGDLGTVRSYFDALQIWAADPIVVTEIIESDCPGRIVPASEWDVMEDC